ncbi:MAG: winged helix-turn-helix domain-containing protein [Candidatus Liptonbacteria bacterium]
MKQDNNRSSQPKSAQQMERHIKGIANHWRIEIIFMIAEHGGITVEGIAKALNSNLKTIAEHTRRLAQAGLVNKKYRGRMVEHNLSPYGKTFVLFLKAFRNSSHEK